MVEESAEASAAADEAGGAPSAGAAGVAHELCFRRPLCQLAGLAELNFRVLEHLKVPNESF